MLGDCGELSFKDLRGIIADWPNRTGKPFAMSDLGEPYVEFLAGALARPGDEEIIERCVASDMLRQLRAYFVGRLGLIYWRAPLETEIQPTRVIIRYGKDGPDRDEVTNERCFKDDRWISIKAYARLVRARAPAKAA